MKCQNCKDKFDETKIPKLNDRSLCAHCRDHWARKLKEREEDILYPPPKGIVPELEAHYARIRPIHRKGG